MKSHPNLNSRHTGIFRKKLIQFLLIAVVVVAYGIPSTSVSAVQDLSSQVELRSDDQVAHPGETVVVPVSFSSGGTEVAGLQLDINLPSYISCSLVDNTGPLVAAGKKIEASKNEDSVRVLIYGFDREPIPDGVIANLEFSIAADALPGTTTLLATNLVATDPDAHPVNFSVKLGTITIETSDEPPDDVEPTISDITITGITDTQAVISWTTNEDADSQVEYWSGESAHVTVADAALKTAHSLALSGLQPDTKYSLTVRSKDAVGNEATLEDMTFSTTDSVRPTISNVATSNVTDTSATVSWSTNENADSRVEYWTATAMAMGLTPLAIAPASISDTAPKTAHSVALTGLASGTTYSYRVISKDAANNEATSEDMTFSTTDSVKPTISDITITGITDTQAVISWTTNEDASSQVEYWLGWNAHLTVSGDGLAKSHTVSLTGLQPETTYYFIVISKDAAGNTATWTTPVSFKTTAAADVTPPVISGLKAANLGANRATITWTTNEKADSLVEYWAEDATHLTASAAAMVTAHSVALTGLTSGTTYSYRVISKDAAGNPTTSATATFKTIDNTPPKITSVSASGITDTKAVISWTTDEDASSQVEYSQIEYWFGWNAHITASGNGLAKSHTVSLTGLKPETTYYFIVISKDAAGNTATWTTPVSFKTTAAADATPPVISGLKVANLGANNASITWMTNEKADSTVEYWVGSTTHLTASAAAMVTAHPVALSGLTSGTTYSYRVISKDAAGNPTTSATATFKTIDNTPPKITSVSASGITDTKAVISWTTDEDASSQVEYWLGWNAHITVSGDGPTKSHSVTLTGLQPETTYSYRVISKDAAGNPTTSATATFKTTAPADVTPPVISGLRAANLGTNGASISWTTNERADSLVEYWAEGTNARLTASDATMITSHSLMLSGLASGTTYSYRAVSKDAAGNRVESAVATFKTPDVTPPKITGVSAGSITDTKAVISWTTDEDASSQVEYSQVEYWFGWNTHITVSGNGLAKSHSVTLTGLKPETMYYFIVRSKDAAGNTATLTTPVSFRTTAAADVTPPVISNVAVRYVTSSSAIITWTTNEKASSTLSYGQNGNGYGRITLPSYNLTTMHSVTLFGLNGNTNYSYELLSTDAAGNQAKSYSDKFKTLKK